MKLAAAREAPATAAAAGPERVAELLEKILAELRLIRERLPEQPAPDERLERLVAAIYLVGEGETFSAAGLAFDSTARDPAAAALRSAILSCAGRRPDGLVRRLGAILSHNVGEVGGWRLERVGRGRDGTTYRLVRLEESKKSRADTRPGG